MSRKIEEELKEKVEKEKQEKEKTKNIWQNRGGIKGQSRQDK